MHHKKCILITGGAGFIGSHLCSKLLAQGHEIICMDNYFSGSKQNVRKFVNHPNFELVRHDVTIPFHAQVDEIYNLACPASPIHYQYDPIKTLQTSVIGALNMLNLAKNVNAKILQASTSEIYGDPTVHPQKEIYWGNVNPIGIRACYDEGKRCAETLFMDYNKKENVSTRIVRIFNTYGPYMQPNDGRVVSNFIMQALLNKDITIYGDGSQTRSFQYIDDLIEGMILMMNSSHPGPVNLGNPTECTVKQLADVIISLTNSKSQIIYKPLPLDDPQKRKPSIKIAESLLGWSPVVDLHTGLKKTIEYFKNIIYNTEAM
jgi:UDP-glucuronate decarboxylase